LSLEVVVVDLLVGLPKAGESRGDLHAILAFGGGVVAVLSLGTKVEMADKSDAQEEAQGVDVRDWLEAGHH